MTDKIIEAIKKLKENSKKRKFEQTFDLIINLKEIDVKKPENKINEEVRLPHGLGREVKIVLFSDNIKELDGVDVLNSSDIERLGKNKRLGKKLIKQTDFFLAEPKLMPAIGKALGQTLAPKGKMPKIVSANLKSDIENLKNSTRIRIKDSPVIQCAVGKENMEEWKVAENIMAVIKHLETRLPRGKDNIKEVLLKLTMSKPIKLELW
jgi:large subunit ribosomal protein L1